MKKKYRRIYALSLVIVFIVVAPILLLYATGFRYDFSERKVVKTGVLSIDSDPRGAQILVDGENVGAKTPKVVKNLLPGEYNVTIEKAEYFSWEKNLSVFANQSTTTERVSLLKSDGPTLAVEEKISNLAFSPGNSYLAYTTVTDDGKNGLVVKQESTLRTVLTVADIDSTLIPIFSENEKYVFLKNTETGYIARVVSLSSQFDILISDISKFPVSKLIATNSDNVIYAVTENGLNLLNLAEGSIQLAIAGTIQDGVIINDSLYYIQNTQNSPQLYKSNLNSIDNSEEMLTFSSRSEYSIANSPKEYITLLDVKNHELSLIKIQDQFSITLDKLNPDVISFAWSPDGKDLLLYNEFEIWIYNLELRQQDLLIRSSNRIKHAVWSPDGEWIIYSQDGFVKAIELDGRGKRNSVNLAQTDLIPFAVNSHTKTMFYFDSSQNLFQKSIQ